MAAQLRPRFEDRQVRVPVSDAIRRDLHSVKRVVTAAGNIRYDAERSEAGGSHADRFWALALASHAATGAVVGPVTYESVQPARFARAGAW
jgi:phage FluMu gp28-like protein